MSLHWTVTKLCTRWSNFAFDVFEMGGGAYGEPGLPISVTFQEAQPPAQKPIYNTNYR